MSVKYPHVKVTLIGEDGNAFFILGKVAKAMRRAGVPAIGVSEYTEAAMSGDYNNLLRVTMEYVDVE